MYLRFKRKGRTYFIPCEPREQFGKVKERLAALVERHPDSIQCYQYLTPTEKKEQMERRIEEKRRIAEDAVKKRMAAEAAAAAASKKKKTKKDKKSKKDEAPAEEAAPIKIEIKLELEDTDPTYNPPLQDGRSVENQRLPTDRIIMFVFENKGVWEPIDVPGCQVPEVVPAAQEEKKSDAGETVKADA
jgi:hypothetical protein